MTLTELPFNILDGIISVTPQEDLTRLSQTNKCFRFKINQSLYRKILITNEENVHHDEYTVIPVGKLDKFAASLNSFNFGFIHSIYFQVNLSLEVNDYQGFYDKICQLWNEQADHKIYLFNFDCANLRHYQLFNALLSSNLTYIEDTGESKLANLKINNLQNWIVHDMNEFISLPFNPNLRHLDIVIDRSLSFLSNPLQSIIDSGNTIRNLVNVESLNLDSPSSVQFLVQLYKECPFAMDNLTSLSLTSSHNYRHPKLDYQELSKFINFNALTDFELKVNCNHTDCQCITNFFNNWFSASQKINLKKLVLLNYKSVLLPNNINQFNQVLRYFIFNSKLESLNELVININDFTKPLNSTVQFDLKMMIDKLPHLSNLSKLVIPDFFNRHLKQIKPFISHFTKDFEDKPILDLILNHCHCDNCQVTRFNFKHLAQKGYNDNHNYSITECPMGISNNVNVNDKSTQEFFNYIIINLKNEFASTSYLRKNFHHCKSSFTENFIQLINHGIMGDLFKFINTKNDDLHCNFGGISV